MPADKSESRIGYTPRVITPMIGLTGKVRPVLLENTAGEPKTRSARIDLGLVYSVGADEIQSATYGTGQTVDRLDVAAAEFDTQLNVPENQWTLAGLVSLTSANGKSNGDKFAIIVRWMEAK
ncbi:MAG: hypothetical protein R3C05_18915 [Pirellulaceae bacterium]